MKTIFCITSPRSVGCTFFDWSVHFLSGQTDFFQAQQRQWMPLCNNPLTNINAHSHKKNHPCGFNDSVEILTQFINQTEPGVYSCYPIHMFTDLAISNLGLQVSDCEKAEFWNQVCDYVSKDFNCVFDFCIENKIKFIFVDLDTNYSLYFLNVRALERKIFETKAAENAAEMQEEFQQVFFNTSLRSWQDSNLTEIWDQRERLALDTRPLNIKHAHNLNLTQPHLWLTSSDLWFRGPQTVKKMLNYLDLTLDIDRWNQWLPIYYKWQEMQLDLLEFDFKFDHIIESIVKNWYYELGELSLYQEAAIQHALIYQHNLNLKTWQLKKFPSNTQDLHKLLEPNIHPIENF